MEYPKIAKVIPIGRSKSTRQKLIEAVGTVLAREGFGKLSAAKIVSVSGVSRALLFRYFNGLDNLVAAFGRSNLFWPSAEELIGDEREHIQSLDIEEQIGFFFKRYMAALRRRPQTIEILAWESRERNRYTAALEYKRVRTALEFFELLHGEIPEEVDLSAVVVILAAAVNYLVIRSRLSSHFGGVDLASDKGWQRIENGIDILLKGIVGTHDS